MSNVVTDFHNFRNLYSSTDLFGLFGMCFSRYNFDRNIMYLDQSTLLNDIEILDFLQVPASNARFCLGVVVSIDSST